MKIVDDPEKLPMPCVKYSLYLKEGGAGIHAHPMGPRAGAKAFREAIDACMNDVPLREAAKTGSKELKVAIEKWGIYGEDHSKNLYAL